MSESAAHAVAASPPFRIGLGWDRHRLEPIAPAGAGRPLVLGTVRLEHDRGPVSHSDGDALLHAITDAVLGALGFEDIGQLFPNDDPRNAGADSRVFLEEAIRRMREAGWAVANLDAVVALERPRLGPHKPAMRAAIAGILGVPVDRVNIKGKTGEGVDAVGDGRAVDAHAVVLLAPAGDGR